MMERPDRWCAPLWEARQPRPVRAAWWIWAATIVAAIGLAAWAGRDAQGAVFLDCRELAVAMGVAADFRDTGAELDKVIAMARRRNAEALNPAQLAALEREIRRVWAEKIPVDDVPQRTFERCRSRLGDMGLES